MPDDFLFAAVGEQQNGMPLNVVSGLTRLGLDPWEEAARLAALPRALATEKLAPIIARLPLDRPEPSDNLAISRMLIELLPEHRQAALPSRQPADAKGKKYIQAMIVLSCLALGAAVLFSML
jgi:hypothetical protein